MLDAPQAAAGATIIVPLETLLTAGLRFGIDAAEPKVYPFTFCAQIGCVARIGFTADELASFKKGAKGVLTIVPGAIVIWFVRHYIAKGFAMGRV